MLSVRSCNLRSHGLCMVPDGVLVIRLPLRPSEQQTWCYCYLPCTLLVTFSSFFRNLTLFSDVWLKRRCWHPSVQRTTSVHQRKQDWLSSPYSFVVHTDEHVLFQDNLPPALIFLPQHRYSIRSAFVLASCCVCNTGYHQSRFLELYSALRSGTAKSITH